MTTRVILNIIYMCIGVNCNGEEEDTSPLAGLRNVSTKVLLNVIYVYR